MYFHENNDNRPYIVHFCGHGAGDEGLVLEGGKLLSNNALSNLFEFFGEGIECVLLNACTTEIQADVIQEYVPYVIGTSREILDRAAYLFAVGFYEALGYGETIERCYKLGCNAVEIGLNKVKLLPEISETSRKFEVIDLDETQAKTEPLKIILKKNSNLSNSDLSTNIPPKFQKTILEEVNRKDYYDNLRHVLERFGQTTIEREKPISKFEYEQRQTLLKKVQAFWIEGFLKPSLYFNTAIDKEIDDPSGQILRPLTNLEVIPIDIDESYDELQQTDIIDQIGDGKTLLILGDPGSGKTIALLQLAERLIKLTQQVMTKPIPVVFNLSSWGQKQQPLEEWLIEELITKYQVPKIWSEPWIKDQQLTLLLDGLDEVGAGLDDQLRAIELRNACIIAINKFIATHLETEIVVCSRLKDYEALVERLLLNSAICIRPLSKKQLKEFLENADDSLLGLKTVLEQDQEIAEFAQTPLILNMMTWTYQGWSAEQCRKQFRIATDREFNLFESYIEKNLNQDKKYDKYPKNKVLYWLSWLAKTMVKESQTVFLIENMQPTFLQSRSERNDYQIIVGLILGLMFGLTAGIYFIYRGSPDECYVKQLEDVGVLLSRLFIGVLSGLIYGLFLGKKHILRNRHLIMLISGTIFAIISANLPYLFKLPTRNDDFSIESSAILLVGVISGYIAGLIREQIQPVETVKPEFNKIIKYGLILFGWGLVYVLLHWKQDPSYYERSNYLWVYELLVFTILGGFYGGFIISKKEINFKKILPNQGIKRSIKYTGIFFIIFMFFAMLLVWFFECVRDPFYLICIGLAVGSMAGLAGNQGSGIISIQHLILRVFLCWKGKISWNYADFLDYASERLLMKKVGGGYVFYHRMLMEHFAQKKLD